MRTVIESRQEPMLAAVTKEVGDKGSLRHGNLTAAKCVMSEALDVLRALHDAMSFDENDSLKQSIVCTEHSNKISQREIGAAQAAKHFSTVYRNIFVRASARVPHFYDIESILRRPGKRLTTP